MTTFTLQNSHIMLGLAFFGGMLLSGIGQLLLYPILQRRLLASPNSRSSHKTPTPQGGGISVVAATVAVGAIAIFVQPHTAGLIQIIALLAAVILLAAVGLADDVFSLEAMPRLGLQLIAVVIVTAALPPELRVIPELPWWLERILLVVCLAWMINVVNFMDGIDWMTVANFVPIMTALAIIGLIDGLPAGALKLALALDGAIIGFAPFNRPIARLFLGDVGTLPLGLLLGWLLVQLAAAGHLAAALLLPLYYLADATITLGHRLARKENVFQAHRHHFYQKAVDNKFTQSEVILHIFVVNGLLDLIALATIVRPGPLTAIIATLAGCIIVGYLLTAFNRGRR